MKSTLYMPESQATHYRPKRPSESEWVRIRHFDYHCRIWGGQKPDEAPVFLLHGWMDVGASFQFLVDAFSEASIGTPLAGCTFIAPDWRGFGLTKHHANADTDYYSHVDYLGDLDFLLRHFSPEQPVDMVAHSMGGNIAMLYAGLRPERVRQLANLEGFGLPQTQATEAPERLRRWLGDLHKLHNGELFLKAYTSLEQVAARLQKNNARLTPDKALWLAQHWAEEKTNASGEVAWHILGAAAHKLVNPLLYRTEEAHQIHAQIEAPVLSVIADNSELETFWRGSYTRAEYLERMQAVRHIEHLELANCGHMLHHDQPRILAEKLSAFFTSKLAPL